MEIIKVKPLSINKAWRGGKRFKTKEYLAYEQELFYRIPKIRIPNGKKSLIIRAGFSNKNTDADNIVKPLQDILSKKFGFNDNEIYYLEVLKEIVKKGEEYIGFEINAY